MSSPRNVSLSVAIMLICILLFTFLFEHASYDSKIKISSDADDDDIPPDAAEYYTVIATIAFLVPLGGIFAGLAIGLLSLDPTNLNILSQTGSSVQKKHAEAVLPLMKSPHLLLVSLLLANTLVNETLPVLLHLIHLDGWQAVLVSTTLVLLFGEIIPQAICARHGLAIGAFFSKPLRLFMNLIWIVAYPIAKLLDYVLGNHTALVYRRAELRELVTLHGLDAGGTLTKDEVSILRAVLDINEKTVFDIMTRLSLVFMLEIDTPLDKTTLEAVKIS